MTSIFAEAPDVTNHVSKWDGDPLWGGGIPVAFGRCAGMFHPGESAEAILVMPAYGHEAIASARALRQAASKLSAAGYPVLRLEPHGTGDAPGDESCLDLAANRSESLREAMCWLQETVGARRVSMIALRLGATIAMLECANLEVARLVLVSPVLTGRGYLRELRQMQNLYAQSFGRDDAPTSNEFNGFRLSDDSIDALQRLDVRRAGPPRAQEIALLAPDGSPGVVALADSWRGCGREVDLIGYTNTDKLLADPAASTPDTQLADLLGDWFGEPREEGDAIFAPAGPAIVAGPGWTERAERFGEDGRFFGVLCRPEAPRPGAPALIIPNTGGNSHIGWGRQTVELARQLARQGIATLRMDIAGVGESLEPSEKRPRVVYVGQAGEDIVAAVRFMETRGYRKPALLGICSGAFLVFHALRLNAPVSGAFMINLQKFFWQEGDPIVLYNSVGSYAARLFEWASVRRLLKGEADVRGIVRVVSQRLATMFHAWVSSTLGRSFASAGQDDMSPYVILSRACDRGTVVTMANTIHDGGIDEIRTHLGSRGRRLRHKPGFRVETIAVADHNFSSSHSREALLPAVLDFVKRIGAK